MTRYLANAELVFNPDGSLAQNVPFTLWDDPTAGTQITDVVAPDGVSPVTLVTTGTGLTPMFRLPDEVWVAYADTGATFRQKVWSPEGLAARLGSGGGGGTVAWVDVLNKPAALTSMSLIGQNLMTAGNAAAGRDVLGAGTSNVQIGTTSTTAKAGNWLPGVLDLPLGFPWTEPYTTLNRPYETTRRHIVVGGTTAQTPAWFIDGFDIRVATS